VPSTLKRILVGRPIPSSEADHQRLSNAIALPVFSSDAISSTAYATGEILAVTAVGGASSLALGLSKMVPIAIAVALILVVVVVSYRQTIFAYPSGGGSYIVSRENLGARWAILAAASLLIDYILTVAVSITAGVEALISIDDGLVKYRVLICLLLIALMTVANLRGLKESGALFAPPVYLYIGMVVLLLIAAFIKHMNHKLGIVDTASQMDICKKVEEGITSAGKCLKEDKLVNLTGGNFSWFIVLKGFASGAVALTGVEAISNGVPAFKKPESRNASRTMIYMGAVLGTLFLGTAILASKTKPYPSSKMTAIAQMGKVVFGAHGTGHVLFLILQISTFAILTLAANTAYADFPRLAQLIAKDGYLPRQFANFGDRLVFSNGILVLAGASALLVVAFGGVTTLLIPLYAVGVFTAFTLSQTGMIIHHLKLKEPNWQTSIVINTIGAIVTFIILLIVAITKFTGGAWIPIVIIPPVMFVFTRVKKHYDTVSHSLAVTPSITKPVALNHTVIVLVGRIHRGVLKALAYAESLRPQHLVAVTVAADEAESIRLQKNWEEFGIKVPLDIVHSPYRELVRPIRGYIEQLDTRWADDTITIVIPEFVVTKWYHQILHNQTALRLKGSLLFREGIVVTSVPYLMDGDEAAAHREAVTAAGINVHEHHDGHDHSSGDHSH
jgi:amino acid transporter